MALQKMGLGKLGSDNIIFKRKFRWTFEASWMDQEIPAYYVKVANRPTLNVEETPINFLNGRMYLPGKGEWDTLSLTYYDVAINGSDSQGVVRLYSWLATVYNFTDPDALGQASKPSEYGATGTLILYDGCGALEEWTLKKMWPTSVNFGDLAYDSSDEVTIELTLRFSEVKYTKLCGNGEIKAECTSCQGGKDPENAAEVANLNIFGG